MFLFVEIEGTNTSSINNQYYLICSLILIKTEKPFKYQSVEVKKKKSFWSPQCCSNPFNAKTMLKPCSRQLLINSILGLMLAVANEEGSDRGTEKHICCSVTVDRIVYWQKSMLSFLLAWLRVVLRFSLKWWLSVWSVSCLFSVLPDQPPCKCWAQVFAVSRNKLLTTEWNNFSAFDGFSCKDWAVTNQYCTSCLEICWANYYTNCPNALNSSWAKSKQYRKHGQQQEARIQ